MSDQPAYKVVRTNVIVTKPNGDVTQKETLLYRDRSLRSVGVKFVQSEIDRIDVQGVDMPSLPNSLK